MKTRKKSTKNMNLSPKDYRKILKFYKLSIPKKVSNLRKKGDKIIAKKFCSCIKKVRTKFKKEGIAIGICTKSVITRKGIKRGKFNCKKRRSVKLFKGGSKRCTKKKTRRKRGGGKKNKQTKKTHTRHIIRGSKIHLKPGFRNFKDIYKWIGKRITKDMDGAGNIYRPVTFNIWKTNEDDNTDLDSLQYRLIENEDGEEVNGEWKSPGPETIWHYDYSSILWDIQRAGLDQHPQFFNINWDDEDLSFMPDEYDNENDADWSQWAQHGEGLEPSSDILYSGNIRAGESTDGVTELNNPNAYRFQETPDSTFDFRWRDFKNGKYKIRDVPSVDNPNPKWYYFKPPEVEHETMDNEMEGGRRRKKRR